MTNAAIKKIAEAPSAISCLTSNLVRAGFELEFQGLDGVDGGDCVDGDIDYNALSEASYEAWCEEDPTDHIDNDDPIGALACALIKNGLDAYDIKDRGMALKVKRTIESAMESWREDWENENANDYLSNGIYENLTAPRIRDLIDCGEDPSVRGGEIRTVGALTPGQFVKVAKTLLSLNDFDVDTGCSFHIHLSVPGVKHFYGEVLQREAMAYLMENYSRMTPSMKNRMRSDERMKYAALKISTDKFTAVHYHNQGTWEFRLFGNINDTKSAYRALVLAVEALQHAYRVVLGQIKGLAHDLTFSDAVHDEHSIGDFKKVARELRKKRALLNRQGA